MKKRTCSMESTRITPKFGIGFTTVGGKITEVSLLSPVKSPGNKQVRKRKADTQELSDTERRVLLSLHLQGVMGKCGSLTRKERKELLTKLIEKGYLSQTCQLTQRGIDAVSPKFSNNGTEQQ